MAYMNMEIKRTLAPKVKEILKKYGLKGSLSTDRHSITLNIKSGPLDFIKNYNDIFAKRVEFSLTPYKDRTPTYLDINRYGYSENYTGKIKSFLKEIFPALNNGNWDNSAAQTDYFDVGWYVNVRVGKWDKPYELTT